MTGAVVKFLEEDIEKYARRVRKIEKNPDPKRAASNKLYYELVLDEYKKELEALKSGGHFIFSMTGRPEIFESMGFHVIWLDILADRMVGRQERYFKFCRKAGYPERSLCDRLQVALGMVLSGDLPEPIFVFGDNTICDAITQTMLAIAHHCHVPYYFLDRFQEPDYQPLAYLTRQLNEVIELLEKTVPGTKFDERKLFEIQKKESEAQEHIRRVWNAAKAKPCPISGKEAFRIPELRLASRPGGLKYFKAFADEIEDRVKMGRGALDQEKLRFLWCVTAPFYVDSFALLESRGVAVPAVLMDTARNTCGLGPGKIDWEIDGTKISPLEQEAELMTTNSWMGPAERWVKDIIDNCREFDIDAVVYFLQTGCPTTLTSKGIVVERVERELGIPVLVMEGWMLDEEKFDQTIFEDALVDFVEMCLRRKGLIE